MISLNDVLLAMSNIPVDDPIAEIWGRGLQGGYKIIEYTGTFPITITANGDALLDYRIYGADGGVGEATENLFDYTNNDVNNGYISSSYISADGEVTSSIANWCVSEYIQIQSNTNYFLKIDTGGYNDRGIAFYDSNKNYISGLNYRYGITNLPFLTSSNAEFVRLAILKSTEQKVMLVEGSTAPTSYIPYGYKLPMMVMDNLAPPLSQWVDGYVSISGVIVPPYATNREKSSDFIEVDPNTQYVFSIEGGIFPQGTNGAWVGVGMYRDDWTFIQRVSTDKNSPYTFSTKSDAKYVRLSYRAYGELLEPRLSENSFSIPVYIGENQLEEDEYVSYVEQKIYRDVRGTPTPTDPPVSLPEIPTIDGTTTIDYDGTPKPSQMYVKYKGKG